MLITAISNTEALNEQVELTAGTMVVSIESWVFILLGIFALFLLLLLAKVIIKKIYYNASYFEHVVLLVKLPKDKPGDQQKDHTLQHLHEEIAAGETIFSAIGGLRSQRGIAAWFLGRNDHYAFEIVAHNKLISFYVSVPKKMASYIEQQISAHYPEASIEEITDYNIFSPQSEVYGGYLRTTKHFVFPLKTYKKMEVDPMNSLINAMSKVEPEDGIAIQYVVRSSYYRWHNKAREVVRNIVKGKSLKEATRITIVHKVWDFTKDLIKSAKPEDKNKPQASDSHYRLSAMEQEIVKSIEEKNAKAGLDANIRIIVSAKNKGQAEAYLDNIVNAFSQYNYYEYGNIFLNKIAGRGSKQLVSDFIYRRFNDRISFLLNTEELASLFHFPLHHSETPNILWLTAKNAPAPVNIPDEGIILGKNIFRRIVKDVKMKRDDRRRHMYIVGKSGVGKSQFLANLAIQDILSGEGVGVIDPHGDLIADILDRIPPERAEDVILFSPADTQRPLGLNLLEYDPKYPEQKTFVINEMIKIFDKLYDLRQTGGPIFEQYMRNAMLLVMSDPESGSTLMEIPKVLADAEFRRLKLERCKDPTVVDFWRKEAEKAGGDAALANIVPYITSKLTSFISNDMMRPIIAQQRSAFNLREVMDRKKILLVDLPKGLVGETNAYLLGMILVGKILMAALSRTDIPREHRRDFYLYIDEFQNFTTDSISSILSEARKYNLNLIMAHQYIGQLVRGQDTTIKDAVFGNVGTWIVFKVGSEDAQALVKEFSPVFNEYDLINIEKYSAYVKLLIDNTAARAFSMHAPWPLPGVKKPELAKKIRSLSRLKYGQDRHVVESEIMKRVKLA